MRRTWLLGLLLVTVPDLAAARGAAPSAEPIHRFVKPAFEEIVVRWQLHSWFPGGQIRLYRGRDTGSVHLIHAETARAGIETYQVRDLDAGADEVIYELRYAEASGRERSLGKIRCVRIDGLRELPPAGPEGSGPLLVACLAAAGPAGGWVELGQVPAAAAVVRRDISLSPPVPPPEAGPAAVRSLA